MPGITPAALDARYGPRVKRYMHQFVGALTSTGPLFFNCGGCILMNSGGRGRIVNLATIAGTDAGTNTWTLLVHKRTAIGTGIPVVGEAESIPINSTGVAATIAATRLRGTVTPVPLAPDESDGAAKFGSVATAGSATSETLSTDFLAALDFYIGGLIQRLDTMEVQPIDEYTAGRVTTHPAWTRGTTTAPVGTPVRIIHDNLIVRNGDQLSVTTTVGASAPNNETVVVDVLDLSDIGVNN